MTSLRHRLLALGAPLATAALVATLVPSTDADAADAAGASATPVLGSSAYMTPYGEGWGTAHPREVYNGGDPSGSADHLRWKHWGEATTTARGLTPIFRPGGGYYARPGHIKFRAEGLSTCADGTYAYTRLEFRVSTTPDGPLGPRWRLWSGSEDICG